MAKPKSLTAYARRRGVTAKAVSKAIADGRLRESVVRDDRGAPKIADADLADREWRANTRPRIDVPEYRGLGEITFTDPRTGFRVTAREVLEERDTHSLLRAALVSAAVDTAGRVDPRKVIALRKRVARSLLAVADLFGADDDEVARAELDLDAAVAVLMLRHDDAH